MSIPTHLKNLITLRKDWEETANGESLIKTMGSVGLILFDVCRALRLSSDQELAVLGSILIGNLAEHFSQSVETDELAEDQFPVATD